MSYIEDGVPELVANLERARLMHETYGLPILNQPINKWPAKLVEALEVLRNCNVEEHNARVRAEMKASQ